MKFAHVLSAAILLAGGVQMSSAAVVYLQDVGGNSGFTFNGTPVTQATFDDTYLQLGGSASTLAANFGSSASMQIRTTSTGLTNYAILAVKDLFTLVPATSGGDPITINSATLYLASGTTTMSPSYTINVRRITTDWLANASGDNEGRASGNQRNATTTGNGTGGAISGGTGWASTNYGSNDYTATNAALAVPYVTAVYGTYIPINVTGMVTDMYNLNVNEGFSISTPFVDSNFVNIRASEDTLLVNTHETFRPVLAIDYSYAVSVPEPASLATLGLGAAMLVVRRRSRQRRV